MDQVPEANVQFGGEVLHQFRRVDISMAGAIDGELSFASIMAATASFDHRAIDGAVAARFMAALREIIETPLLLVC